MEKDPDREQAMCEMIGAGFVEHYYKLFDSDRSQLLSLYIPESLLIWEGTKIRGREKIMEKLKSLPLTQIQHVVTAQDHHLLPDYIIMSSIIGQLKADNDPVMGFHQTFVLRNINNAWVCINDNFRLAVHNFA